MIKKYKKNWAYRKADETMGKAAKENGGL